jgi:hypothetical protein
LDVKQLVKEAVVRVYEVREGLLVILLEGGYSQVKGVHSGPHIALNKVCY